VRQLFFPDDQSLGQQKIPLIQQSRDPAYAKFRENVRWQYLGITFITLDVPGSNNNFGRTPEMDEEWSERNAANLAWLHDGFDAAERADSAAAMIVLQGNIFPELPPNAGNPVEGSGFTDLRAALAAETLAFGKPVVFVHGDS